MRKNIFHLFPFFYQADVYGDTQENIEDCSYAIEPFIEEVMPVYNKEEYFDYTDVFEMEDLTDEYWIAA